MVEAVINYEGQYLKAGKPEDNIQILAGLSPVNADKGIATQGVFGKVRYWNPSPEKLREWTIYAMAANFFGGVMMMTVGGTGVCVYKNLDQGFAVAGQKCLAETSLGFKDSHARLMAVMGLSVVGLTTLGAYGVARWYFQDSKQEERFKDLKKEYSAVAETLNKNFEASSKWVDKTQAKAIGVQAEKILQNCELMAPRLQSTVRLSKLQTEVLLSDLLWAARKVSTAAKAL